MNLAKSKKLRFFLIFAVVAVIIIGFIFLSSRNNSKSSKRIITLNIIDKEVKIYQFSQKKKALNSALLTLQIINLEKERARFSIFLDLDNDDKFDEQEKAVDDVPALIEKNLSNGFPLRFNDEKKLKKFLDLSFDKPIKTKVLVNDLPQEVSAEKTKLEIGDIFAPAQGFSGSSFVFAQEKKDLSKVPVSNTGVQDLDGRKGKPNECVPISLANSLLWLGKKHKFDDKLPEDSDDLIDELAKDLKWTKDGVKNENILVGKEAFTKRRKLPLVNKKIDNEVIEGESQLWSRIVEELNRGEDVELLLDFKQSPKGKAEKGHAVTVVAADKNKKGKKFISVHDPATPKASETYEVDRNGQILGYPLGKAYVNFILSESLIKESPTPTQSPSKAPTPTSAAVPTATPTPQPASATNTPTPTISSSATSTPTPNLTATLTPTLTATPTATPSPTLSPT
ncbi:hypothetical protein HY612_03455 [Candidatus Roizmanbacteria bacterium]|nr:hypothetical protein [Candidatus Roizmanbacteria bacterium]